MIVCIIRHGQTEWNKKSLFQGISDNELNEKGINQATEVGLYLLNNDKDWDVFISSPLKRAKQTAEIIKEKIGFKDQIQIDNDFVERKFGILEGLEINEAILNLIDQEITEGLETKADLQIRSLNALLNLEEKYKDKKILAFSHAQFIKSIITQLDPKYNFRSLLKNSSMNYFEIKNRKIRVIKINISAKD